MTEDVRFASVRGPELAGVLEPPEHGDRGWGLFIHGFTLGKDSPAAFRISRGLAAEGIGMLRYDALGVGRSGGELGDGSFTVKVADTVRAAELLTERGTPPQLLVGHSRFVAGFTLGTDSPAAFRISRGLAAEGIGMLRYDALGVGGSGRELGDCSFTVKVADTVRAAEFLTERGTPPQLLVGHSWGGAEKL